MPNERQQIAMALGDWWASQQVSPITTAYVMTTMAGTICGDAADGADEDFLKEGLGILTDALRRAAYSRWKESSST